MSSTSLLALGDQHLPHDYLGLVITAVLCPVLAVLCPVLATTSLGSLATLAVRLADGFVEFRMHGGHIYGLEEAGDVVTERDLPDLVGYHGDGVARVTAHDHPREHNWIRNG